MMRWQALRFVVGEYGMTFAIHACAGTMSSRITNPNQKAIDWAVNQLKPEIDYFVVLTKEPALKKCDCVQTLKQQNRKNGAVRYLVEAHFQMGKTKKPHGKSTKFFRRYVKTAKEVKEILGQFIRGVIPNVAKWKDITAEVRKEICKDHPQKGFI